MITALIGNSFPWSLVRRSLRAEPMTLTEFQKEIADVELVSFWGHPETLSAVSALCGRNLKPRQERVALSLSARQLPALAGCEYRICYLVSPDFEAAFRPLLNVPDAPQPRIVGWSILKLIWQE